MMSSRTTPENLLEEGADRLDTSLAGMGPVLETQRQNPRFQHILIVTL